jgi:hypothetical protein
MNVATIGIDIAKTSFSFMASVQTAKLSSHVNYVASSFFLICRNLPPAG